MHTHTHTNSTHTALTREVFVGFWWSGRFLSASSSFAVVCFVAIFLVQKLQIWQFFSHITCLLI